MRCATTDVVRALLVAAGLLVISGCADAAGAADAAAAASAFVGAVLAGDGVVACGLLADPAVERLSADAGQPCERAVLSEEVRASLAPAAGGSGGSGDAVHVAGSQAQVRRDGVVLFLAASADGWKVTAAGCTPRDGRPYDCVIEGG